MEKDLTELFVPDCTAAEAGNYSPLVLAFAGDAAYELLIRTMLVKRGNAHLNDLNRRKASFVKASAQSRMMAAIEPYLTQAEADIYKRGRNAKTEHTAKNASVQDYRRATGFEALMGYLYLQGETERMLELVRIGVESEERNRRSAKDAQGTGYRMESIYDGWN